MFGATFRSGLHLGTCLGATLRSGLHLGTCLGATFRSGLHLGTCLGLHLGQAPFRARATFRCRTNDSGYGSSNC